MKELTLKELQEEELNILKDIHAFCEEKKIRYSLYGGTQIGAMRHKGFIPWDDDIDIIMPRPDYNRFCQEYDSEKYKVADLESNKDYMLGFARVYDDKRTTMVSTIPWLPTDVGVWVDVFPADGMPLEESKILSLYKKVIILRRCLLVARGAFAKYSTYNNFLDKAKLTIKKIVTLNGYVARIFVKRLNDAMQTYDYETSPYWASLSNVRSLKEHKHHKKSTFDDCIYVDFEDIKACIMNGTDEVLRERYKDYMKLPPENERVPKQDYIHFYWKD